MDDGLKPIGPTTELPSAGRLEGAVVAVVVVPAGMAGWPPPGDTGGGGGGGCISEGEGRKSEDCCCRVVPSAGSCGDDAVPKRKREQMFHARTRGKTL